jgi:DNA-binding XRE family transcriptional regulator
MAEICKACTEALDVYLYEPEGQERGLPLPDEALDGKKNIIKIQADPKKAFAILLRNYRLNSRLTQKQAAEMLGMKNLYSYQRLEKASNPTLTIINKVHAAFPGIKLEYLFL